MEINLVIQLTDEVNKKQQELEELEACDAPEKEIRKGYQELDKLKRELDSGKVNLIIEICAKVSNERHREVLISRYVKLEKYWVIANKMLVGQRQIFKLHKAGLKAFKAAEVSENAE